MAADLVTIGRIVRAHGLHGEVSVEVLSDVPGRLDPGAAVVVGGDATTVVSSRPHQGRLLVRFAGVDNRTGAELLRGRVVEAEPVDLADTDTYFVHELVGMSVEAADGRHLGEVTALVELPDAAGYDLLEVSRSDGSTWLLPAVDDYVEMAEDDDGMPLLKVVDPPQGLLDDDTRPDVGSTEPEAPG